MLVLRRQGDDPAVDEFVPGQGWSARLRRRLHRFRSRRERAPYRDGRPDWAGLFSVDRTALRPGRSPVLRDRRIVHLHWIAGFVDPATFFEDLPAGVPVAWTLHDMNPFTGGCHYDAGCGRWSDRCGECPQLGSDEPEDLSRRVWRRKREAFAALDPDRLHLVTPSAWLADEVRRSSLLGGRFPVTVIPNGLDTREFAPRDRAEARRVLGIPFDARVVLFVAHSVGERRKGFGLLAEALGRIDDVPGLFLLSVGGERPKVGTKMPGRHVEFTADDRLLSLVYSASDLFVLPSLQDNLPTTVLEALACGTPVVAFRVGGVPEMVRPDRTGKLVPAGDVAGLAEMSRELLEDRERLERLSSACRRVAVEEYDLSVQARRHEELYGTLLGEEAGATGWATNESRHASPPFQRAETEPVEAR